MFASSKKQSMPALSSESAAKAESTSNLVVTALGQEQLSETMCATILWCMLHVFEPNTVITDTDALYLVRSLPNELKAKFFDEDQGLVILVLALTSDPEVDIKEFLLHMFRTLSPVYDSRIARVVLDDCKKALARTTPTLRKAGVLAKSAFSAVVNYANTAINSKIDNMTLMTQASSMSATELKKAQAELVFERLKPEEKKFFSTALNLSFWESLTVDTFVSGKYDAGMPKLPQILQETSLNITDVVNLFGLERGQNCSLPDRLWKLGYSILLHIYLKDESKCPMTVLMTHFPKLSWDELATKHLDEFGDSIYETIRVAAYDQKYWLKQRDFASLHLVANDKSEKTLARQVLKHMTRGWLDFVDFCQMIQPRMTLDAWRKEPFCLKANDFLDFPAFGRSSKLGAAFMIRQQLEAKVLQFDKKEIEEFMNTLWDGLVGLLPPRGGSGRSGGAAPPPVNTHAGHAQPGEKKH